jgi:hypothetical protein
LIIRAKRGVTSANVFDEALHFRQHHSDVGIWIAGAKTITSAQIIMSWS